LRDVLLRLLRGVDIKLHGVNDDVFISALGQHQRQQAAPVPISRIRFTPATGPSPNKMPSVPTFIAQRSCATKNCLKVNPLRFSTDVDWGMKNNLPGKNDNIG
jgi:hypothetical protein